MSEPSPDDSTVRGELQLKASDELMNRMREAYKALSQSQGWIREVEPSAFGFNSREEVEAEIESTIRKLERIVDAGNGDNLSQLQLKFATIWPHIKIIISVIRVVQRLSGGL
jgi:hypothetical protein